MQSVPAVPRGRWGSRVPVSSPQVWTRFRRSVPARSPSLPAFRTRRDGLFFRVDLRICSASERPALKTMARARPLRSGRNRAVSGDPLRFIGTRRGRGTRKPRTDSSAALLAPSFATRKVCFRSGTRKLREDGEPLSVPRTEIEGEAVGGLPEPSFAPHPPTPLLFLTLRPPRPEVAPGRAGKRGPGRGLSSGVEREPAGPEQAAPA